MRGKRVYPVAGDPYAQWLAQGGAAAVGPVSGMAGVFRDWVSQPRDFSMEAMLSGPRGPLVDWARSQHPLTQAALATAPIPVVGDLAGLAADARMYASEPESRTLGNAGLSMLGLLPFVPGMTAFHGTPHRFAPEPDAPLGKFRLDKIGTGEGAQAYGHGIYLAESPDVAGAYHSALAPENIRVDDLVITPDELSQMSSARRAALTYASSQPMDDVDAVLATVRRNVEDSTGKVPADTAWWREFEENLRDLGKRNVSREVGGSLYTVDLPDEQIEKMLDWDKPLGDSLVRRVAQKSVDDGVFDGDVDEAVELLLDYTEGGRNGERLYAGLTEQLGSQQAASEFLRELGIPGIRYLDGNSRVNAGWRMLSPDETVSGKWYVNRSGATSGGKMFDTKEAAEKYLAEQEGRLTRNFVLFDPEIAKIIDRK